MNSWRKTLITSNYNLEQAINILDKAGLRIVLIINDSEKLLGTITDGDVRRALLKHVSLDTPVIKVMNSTPKIARECWTKEKMQKLMEKYGLLQLPIVNEKGILVNLYNFQDIFSKPLYENAVFLMAGGMGKRLRPLTDKCPKPMLKLGGKPILEKIIINFARAGFYKLFISTHYMPQTISDYFGDGKKWGVKIKYIHEEEPLGTGGSLGLLPHQEIDKPMFVMNGDLLTSIDLTSFLNFHEINNGVATMCVREYEHTVPYGVITSKGVKIKSMIEKPTYRYFVNAGIYLLNPSLIKSVKPGTNIDMPSLLESFISKGQIVNTFPIHEYWLDIGRIDQFKKAQSDLLDNELY